MSGVNTVYQTLVRYIGNNPAVLVLFCISLYIVIKQEQETRRRYILICFFCLVFVFNDFVRKVLGHFTGIETYYRFFWAVPILFLGAKAIMDVVEDVREKWGKLLAVGIICICIIVGHAGRIELNRGMIPENIYNIPGDIIEVSRMIHEDTDKEQPVVVTDFGILFDLRSYDASFIWGIRRKPYQLAMQGDWYPQDKYQDEMSIARMVCVGIQEDQEYLENALEKRNVDYIITYTEYGLDDYLASVGYEAIGKTDTRTLYGRAG